MVKFLSSLPQVFRERYLQTHEKYLKSIADIIENTYTARDLEEATRRMILKISSQKDEFNEKKKYSDYETPEFRNLRNCWYHECSLNYPFEDLGERLKFASWKIIKCYYAVFSSIASLICCYYPKRKSIDKTLNIYANEFLCNRKRKIFFLPPVNLYLNQQGTIPKELLEMITWEYAHSYHIPNIEECLKKIHKTNRVTTIPHYFKSLRDWATYQDAYLFFRLYGDSPRKNLDFSLGRIAFIHCFQTEYYLIRLFDWNPIKEQFEIFSNGLKRNLNVESPTLLARFKVYSKYFE